MLSVGSIRWVGDTRTETSSGGQYVRLQRVRKGWKNKPAVLLVVAQAFPSPAGRFWLHPPEPVQVASRPATLMLLQPRRHFQQLLKLA